MTTNAVHVRSETYNASPVYLWCRALQPNRHDQPALTQADCLPCRQRRSMPQAGLMDPETLPDDMQEMRAFQVRVMVCLAHMRLMQLFFSRI